MGASSKALAVRSLTQQEREFLPAALFRFRFQPRGLLDEPPLALHFRLQTRCLFLETPLFSIERCDRVGILPTGTAGLSGFAGFPIAHRRFTSGRCQVHR